jgi:hypothetical protein
MINGTLNNIDFMRSKVRNLLRMPCESGPDSHVTGHISSANTNHLQSLYDFLYYNYSLKLLNCLPMAGRGVHRQGSNKHEIC